MIRLLKYGDDNLDMRVFFSLSEVVFMMEHGTQDNSNGATGASNTRGPRIFVNVGLTVPQPATTTEAGATHTPNTPEILASIVNMTSEGSEGIFFSCHTNSVDLFFHFCFCFAILQACGRHLQPPATGLSCSARLRPSRASLPTCRSPLLR